MTCGSPLGQLVMSINEEGKYFFQCQYETTEDKIRCYLALIKSGIYKCLYCQDNYYGENCEKYNTTSTKLTSKCQQQNLDGTCALCYPGYGKKSEYDQTCSQSCIPYSSCYMDLTTNVVYELPCMEDGAFQLGTICVCKNS
ncbi:unnamed protein product (macronuclear) [Paramecium tetraurelia]|uniref:EGF-like domain-containing protein n=1 Tax=Paramecium tetraurelia TaxID=5888 RepID=A0CAJ1_PARTE|nr:uncharacterized protein GSPATT00036588001 [Paramecium tetraurelia]CAK67808.1 unnamed protein product [Paramecium tetraurelia]|eukprot:XP_001435205.1 hypothetical protein (macronuclear) [Paramecium tetraurelia strain d4-2]